MAQRKSSRLTLAQAGEYSPASLSLGDIKTTRAVARATFDVANRRLRHLKEEGLYSMSPAVYTLGDQAKFSSRGLSQSELIEEIERARLFLEDPTSLVSVAREESDLLIMMLTDLSPKELTANMTTDDWNMVHRAVEQIQLIDDRASYDPSDVVMIAASIVTESTQKIDSTALEKRILSHIEYRRRISEPLKTIEPLLKKEFMI